jgi:hypothetical protein
VLLTVQGAHESAMADLEARLARERQAHLTEVACLPMLNYDVIPHRPTKCCAPSCSLPPKRPSA